MKNSKLALCVFLALLPLITAMGSLQPQSPGKIPVPAMKYSATLIDQADVLTDCREVSIDGETFLTGKRGEGTNTIPFDNITDVSFLQEGGKLNGIIKLRDGNSMRLGLDKNQTVYGLTKYGTFQIKLSELKRMTLIKSP